MANWTATCGFGAFDTKALVRAGVGAGTGSLSSATLSIRICETTPFLLPTLLPNPKILIPHLEKFMGSEAPWMDSSGHMSKGLAIK